MFVLHAVYLGWCWKSRLRVGRQWDSGQSSTDMYGMCMHTGFISFARSQTGNLAVDVVCGLVGDMGTYTYPTSQSIASQNL
jgi:hypothetical protein